MSRHGGTPVWVHKQQQAATEASAADDRRRASREAKLQEERISKLEAAVAAYERDEEIWAARFEGDIKHG